MSVNPFITSHILTPLSPPPSPPLRGYLLDGDFFIASSLASTLTKLCVRYLALTTDQQSKNVRYTHAHTHTYTHTHSHSHTHTHTLTHTHTH